MEGMARPIPRSVEEVFRDFRGRRAGRIKALTNGDSAKKDNMCLYGLPNETWEVNFPVDEDNKDDATYGLLLALLRER